MDKKITQKFYPAAQMIEINSLMGEVLAEIRKLENKTQIGQTPRYTTSQLPPMYYDGWEINVGIRYVGKDN